jgi:hypothetical protein
MKPALDGKPVFSGEAALNDYILVALCEWVNVSGLSPACPGKLETFLKERFPGFEAETDALVWAFRLGVPGDLTWNPAGEPRPLLVERLHNRLGTGCGMALSAAAWAVESWETALEYARRAKAG